MFSAEIWRECCPIIRQKNGVGKFLFFASFKSYDYFSEENACFLNSQSLTACQKNSANQGECYPQTPKAEADNSL